MTGVFENLQTGHARGTFDELKYKNLAGAYVDINDLAVSGGGGSSYITAVTAPLAVASGNLSVDLAPYATTSSVVAATASKVDNSRVLTDVPAGAVFTDTLYTHPSQHPISLITGLQAALDAKVDDSQVLTPVPLGAIFTDTLYTHPSQHSISMITGLQGELNSKADSTVVSAGFAGVATDLLGKQNTLTAGSNIAIAGNTISATGGSSLGLQLAGVSQTASTLNFVDLSGSLASGVLSISPPSSYASLSLAHGSNIRSLAQDANGNLVWDGNILTTNSYMVSVLQAYVTTAVMKTP